MTQSLGRPTVSLLFIKLVAHGNQPITSAPTPDAELNRYQEPQKGKRGYQRCYSQQEARSTYVPPSQIGPLHALHNFVGLKAMHIHTGSHKPKEMIVSRICFRCLTGSKWY